jgi:hypothetical protein
MGRRRAGLKAGLWVMQKSSARNWLLEQQREPRSVSVLAWGESLGSRRVGDLEYSRVNSSDHLSEEPTEKHYEQDLVLR